MRLRRVLRRARIGLRIVTSGLFDPVWYLENNPDVQRSRMGAWSHFLRDGLRERRSPSFLFDPQWYLASNSDVLDSGVNPLVHFVMNGDAEFRAPSPTFAPHYYRSQFKRRPPRRPASHFAHQRGSRHAPNEIFNPRYYVETNQLSRAQRARPFRHYMVEGWRADREVSPTVSLVEYRHRLDQESRRANPLTHYFQFGLPAGAQLPPSAGAAAPPTHASAILREVEANHRAGPHFEEFAIGSELLASQARARIFALYLPQFHAIAENDTWWGPGFTEWRNVTRGLPRFVGHQQPRLPRDLGFYDLSTPGVMSRQIDLARHSAIAGFCFYYYRFNGQRLLDTPLDHFLASDNDFPFCLMWPNENWTRRWDGRDSEVLVAQDYQDDDDVALVDDLARYFRDPRYERVNGRPLFFIYRADHIPDCAERLDRWRTLFDSRHGVKPLILMAQSFLNEDPRPFGFEGVVEFPPHGVTRRIQPVETLQLLDPQFQGRYWDYRDAIEASVSEPSPDYPRIRCVVPSWDNEARSPGRGQGFVGSAPALYQGWLRQIVDDAVENPPLGDVPYVFVNAWNEWAEAATLEPDLTHGYAYANATLRAAIGMPMANPVGHILLVGHDAHPYGAQLGLLHLAEAFTRQFGLELTTLLLDDGPLIADFSQLGDVVVADKTIDLPARIDRLVRERDVRAALVHTVASGRATASLARSGCRVVTLVHELDRLIQQHGLEGAAEDIARHSDLVVFPAALVRDAFVAARSRKSFATDVLPQGMYHPIESGASSKFVLHDRLGLPHDSRLIVNVATRGGLRKGFDLFVHLARTAVAMDPRLHFVWVGGVDEELERWFAIDAQEGQLASRLHLLPFESDVSPVFNSAAVFALTSREDPFPTVVMAALTHDVPVVCFDKAGAHVELIRRAPIYGEVVPMGDVSAMAEAIVRLVDRRGFAAGELAELVKPEFDWTTYAWGVLERLMPEVKRVSVIVPNFNYHAYLAERLRSIFEQDYPIYELILLDDASTDESVQIATNLAELAGRDIRIIQNTDNSGNPFAQWSKGVGLASGDYVWIAEADDVADRHFLRRTMESMDKDTVLAFCDSRQLNSDGSVAAPSYQAYYRTIDPGLLRSNFTMNGRDFLERLLGVANVILNASGAVFKRDTLADVLARSWREISSLAVAGDWRIYAELAVLPNARIAYIAQPLNSHRRHDQSVTATLDTTTHLREISDVHDYVRNLGVSPDTQRRQAKYLERIAEQFGVREASTEQIL